ncbi:MAG: chemotaxis protein CheW [Campylobacterales bacterium]|nr:chemotaxis protein CheW [Campylobacterales bacterium]
MANSLYLTFTIKQEAFGVPIEQVAEIMTYVQITELPNTKPWIRGVVNLRGEVAPIIDMRIKFDETRQNLAYNDETIIIAVKTSDDRIVGMIVDGVSEVESISDEELKEAPEIGVSLAAKYLKGIFKKEDNKSVVVLDIDNILAKDELANALLFASNYKADKESKA